jgi:hypothetical protein
VPSYKTKKYTTAAFVRLSEAQHETLKTLAALEGVGEAEWVRARIDEAARTLAQRDDDRRARRRSASKVQPAT